MIPIWTHFILVVTCCIFFVKFLYSLKDFLEIAGTWLIIIWTSWQLTIITRRKLITTKIKPEKKAVVVTGCDSGFGYMIAKDLNDYGFSVYACCLDPEGVGARSLMASALRPDDMKIIALNVTREEDIKKALKTTEMMIMERREAMWALINNAGVITSGEVEWGSFDSFENIININALGVVRMTRAFLPLLRSSINSRIVNMGSVSGLFVAPGLTAYGMSKYAVKAFNEGLRREMYNWGIRVIYIEPDAYQTTMTVEGQMVAALTDCWTNTGDGVRHDFGESYFNSFRNYLVANLKTARPYPEEVTNAIKDAVTSTDPQMKYTCCGYHNRIIIWLFEILPLEILEPLVKLYFIKDVPFAHAMMEPAKLNIHREDIHSKSI